MPNDWETILNYGDNARKMGQGGLLRLSRGGVC